MSMRVLGWTLVLAFFFACGSTWAMGGGGGSSPNTRGRTYKAGEATGYSWTQLSSDAARKTKRPMMIYVYDDALKTTNYPVQHLERYVFPKPEVVTALKDFTLVVIPKSSKTWPVSMLNRARRGVALFFMTSSGTTCAQFTKAKMPDAATVLLAAAATMKRNGASLKSKIKRVAQVKNKVGVSDSDIQFDGIDIPAHK